MSDTQVPRVLRGYRDSVLAVPKARGPSYTLQKHASERGIRDETMVKLLSAVSPAVYKRYHATLKRYPNTSILGFLRRNCASTADALSTADFKNAKDDAGRRAAIDAWAAKIVNIEKGGRQIPVAQAAARATSRKGEQTSAISDFYSKIAEPAAAGVVVQPKKGKGEPAKAKIGDLPRHSLEDMAQSMNVGADQASRTAYGELMDTLNSFRATEPAHVLQVLRMAKEHGLEKVPRGERRVLLDVVLRGSEETLADLGKKDATSLAFVRERLNALKALVSADTQRYMPALAQTLAEKGLSGSFALNSNEAPILRDLLNSGNKEAVCRYMATRETTAGGASLRLDQTNTPLRHLTAPVVQGNISIYACEPSIDTTVCFRKLLADCGCETKDRVWLAPTDSAMYAAGLAQQVKNWSKQQKAEFASRHLAKSSIALLDKVGKMSSGAAPWIQTYALESGKKAHALVKTKVEVNQAASYAFVPIDYVMQ